MMNIEKWQMELFLCGWWPSALGFELVTLLSLAQKHNSWVDMHSLNKFKIFKYFSQYFKLTLNSLL